MMEPILIWCHGGCFSGGSIGYDKELRAYLTNQKICRVIPVDFSLESWDRAIGDIHRVYIQAQWDNPLEGQMIILGGISSGAMMAHFVANQLVLPAVLVCPVIKPVDRHDALPDDLKEKQLKFFGTLDRMKEVQDFIGAPNADRYILYGTEDLRAPRIGFEEWLEMKNVIHDAQPRDHDMCKDLPVALIVSGIQKLVQRFTQRLIRYGRYTIDFGH